MPVTASMPGAGPVPGLHLRTARLERFLVGWMLIEAAVAVTAGIIAGSLALTSSVIDLATRAHPKRSPARTS